MPVLRRRLALALTAPAILATVRPTKVTFANLTSTGSTTK